MTNISSDASNLERINRWDCAISMFKERPFFGYGPGTYMFQYAKYQLKKNRTIISTNVAFGYRAAAAAQRCSWVPFPHMSEFPNRYSLINLSQ